MRQSYETNLSQERKERIAFALCVVDLKYLQSTLHLSYGATAGTAKDLGLTKKQLVDRFVPSLNYCIRELDEEDFLNSFDVEVSTKIDGKNMGEVALIFLKERLFRADTPPVKGLDASLRDKDLRTLTGERIMELLEVSFVELDQFTSSLRDNLLRKGMAAEREEIQAEAEN